MSAPVGLVFNPHSHTVKRKGSVLEAAAPRIPDALLVRLEDFTTLDEQMTALAKAGVRSVFVEGGDGTLQAVLSACFALQAKFHGLPEFAILPGGSTNLAYKVCGLRLHEPEQIVEFIARFRHDSASVARVYQSGLKVESAALATPAIGMLLSTGSLARVMLYAQREILGEGDRGSRAVGEAAMRFILSPESHLDEDGLPLLRGSPLVANCKSFRLQGEHAMSLMTTLPSLSLRLKPFWGEGKAPIAVTHAEWPIRGLRAAFLKIVAGWTGQQMVRHGLTSHRSEGLDLIYTGPVVLDGELLPAPADGRIRIGVSQPISFLR